MMDDLVEVELSDREAFLVIKETLTRIGIASEKEGQKILTQTCHILHKRQRYYIVHFKELFILDGKDSTLTDEDVARRNTIAYLLDHWGLCTLITPEMCDNRIAPSQFKIVSHKDKVKGDWQFKAKYEVGKKKGPKDESFS